MKRNSKKGEMLFDPAHERTVRASVNGKEDLSLRLLASENPTPTETDFSQQAHRMVPLFALPKQHPLFFVSLTPLRGGDYTTATYNNCYTNTSQPTLTNYCLCY